MRLLTALTITALAITAFLLVKPIAQADKLADNGGIEAPAADQIDQAIKEARKQARAEAKKKEKLRIRRLIPHKRQWITIGRCEQPGKGRWGIWWSMNGPKYSGGLGFANSTWSAFRLRGYPARAGDASWFQQMRVAERLHDRYGFSPWGCSAG